MGQELQSHKGKHLFVDPNLAAAAFRAESTLLLRDQIHFFSLYSQLSKWLWELQLPSPSRQQHKPGSLPNHVATTFSNHNQSVWWQWQSVTLTLLQRAVSQLPCIARRFFINLLKKALEPVLTLLPCTVQSWPDTHLSDHGRDWPGGHFCSPTCRSPPYQTSPRLPHCSSQGCCQLLFPTGHWTPSPCIYSPKETLSATTATDRA